MDIYMGFTTIKPEEYDEKTFGLCIREKREMLNKSVRGLAKEIGMSAVYLSDIERGNRPAPTGLISKRDYMADLVKALELTPEEEAAFYSMAKVTILPSILTPNDSGGMEYFKTERQKRGELGRKTSG